MTTPKCKAMGAGAALAPGQGLGTGAGHCVLGQGLQELLWPHILLPPSPRPSLWSRPWAPSKPKASKPLGFINSPLKALLNPRLQASA